MGFAGTAAGVTAKPADHAPTAPGSAVLAFIQAGEAGLSSVGGLSVGLMSATQGAYTREQMLLDIGQGARVAASAYNHATPPALAVRPLGSGAAVSGWQTVLQRAEDAPQLLRPGLLAAQVAGGAGYAGVAGADDLDAVAGADRRGRVGAVSLGSAATLLARIAAMQSRRRLVICDLPAGAAGIADLRALSAARRHGELLIAVQRAGAGAGHELLWAAAGGLAGGGGRELTSQTTNQRGLLASVDVAADDPAAPGRLAAARRRARQAA